MEKKMKAVKSLIVLLVVIAIGIFVYFRIYKIEEAKKVEEVKEKRLVRFDLDSIKRFTIVRPDSSITFERGLGRIWTITSPIKAEADKDPIYTLFNSLDSSDILETVEEKPKDWAVYGLAHPQYCLSMEYDEGDPDTLFFGSPTPVGGMTYVRFASEDRVLAINNELSLLVKRKVNSYRSRTILNVLSDDIDGLEITRLEGDYKKIVIVNDNGHWMVVEPWRHLADEKKIGDLLKNIEETMKMNLIEEKANDLSQYGLDNPQIILNVSLKHSMPNKILLIGKVLQEKKKKHLCYAKQFDADVVFTMLKGLTQTLDSKIMWFIDKQPAKFDREAVNKIILETSQEPVIFYKSSVNAWSVISPVTKNIEPETINLIFSISRFLLINDIYTQNPTPEDLVKVSLDKPIITLSFYQDDNLLTQIQYGKSFMTKNINTYVRTNLSPMIYTSESPVNSTINKVLENTFGS
jgi:hypothetical protein